MYNEENGIGYFPQIQYASGGYVYIIFNSSNELIKLHNAWNGGFVESFSNSYVTWDKSTRTLVYIGNEESVFNKLTHSSLGQANCTITTEEISEVITPYKFTYGKLEEYPDYTEVMNRKADKEYVDIKVPTLPITEGTYKLQVVVDASGNPTYSWVEE